MKTIEALGVIQSELKAPKGQFNSFGKYKYRSCEDILEAVKPLLKKYGTCLTISDEITQIGERYYVKATAVISTIEDSTTIANTAFAREAEKMTGRDESQITGTASSYARKYALNGLFLIDDTKDADTDEFKGAEAVKDLKQTEKVRAEKIDDTKIKSLRNVCGKHIMPESVLAGKYGKDKLEDLTIEDYRDFAKTGKDFMDIWDRDHAG